MSRKSVGVQDIVPLNRGKINRKLRFLAKNIRKGLEASLIEENLGKTIFFLQEALTGVIGEDDKYFLRAYLSFS